jgi:hypothetical protein
MPFMPATHVSSLNQEPAWKCEWRSSNAIPFLSSIQGDNGHYWSAFILQIIKKCMMTVSKRFWLKRWTTAELYFGLQVRNGFTGAEVIESYQIYSLLLHKTSRFLAIRPSVMGATGVYTTSTALENTKNKKPSLCVESEVDSLSLFAFADNLSLWLTHSGCRTQV